MVSRRIRLIALLLTWFAATFSVVAQTRKLPASTVNLSAVQAQIDALNAKYATLLAQLSTVGNATTVGANLATHVNNTNNPHNVTAAQLGVYTTNQVDAMLGNKSASQTATDQTQNTQIASKLDKTAADGLYLGKNATVDYSSSQVINKPPSVTSLGADNITQTTQKQFVSATEKKLWNDLASNYQGNALIVYDGNSLWQGTGSSHLAANPQDWTPGPFPVQTRSVLATQFPGATFTSYNFGIAGQTTAQMLSDVVSQVDVLYNPASFDRQIVVCGEITNQLSNGSGFTAQQSIDNYVKYCKDRRAKGFLVVCTTVMPRITGFTNISAQDFETARTTVNNYIRANYLQFADALADIAAVPGLTFPDGIHSNDAGYVILGNYVATKVAPLLIQGFNPQSIPLLFSGQTVVVTNPTTPVVSNPGSTTYNGGTTLLVLHGSGTNNSTNIIDDSGYNRAITVNGNAKISTAQAKYGSSSLYFEGGNNSYLTINSSSDFNLGTGNFTLEAWVYPTARAGGYPAILTRGDWGDVQWTWAQDQNSTNGQPDLFVMSGGSYVPQNSNNGGTLPLSSWTHIAVVSSGGVRKTYTNGVLTGQSSVNTSMEATAVGKPLQVGILSNPGSSVGFGNYYQGYMHLRLTKLALYTGNFAPPASF